MIGTPPVVGGMKDAGLAAVVMFSTWQPAQPICVKRVWPAWADAFCVSTGGGSSMRMKSAKRSMSARPSACVSSSGSSLASRSTPNWVTLSAQLLRSVGKSGFVTPISLR